MNYDVLGPPFVARGGWLNEQWYACRNPERPPDERSLFHVENCKGCRLALWAAVTIEPAPGAFRGWWNSRDDLIARGLVEPSPSTTA